MNHIIVVIKICIFRNKKYFVILISTKKMLYN
jgi:hypothetical protein